MANDRLKRVTRPLWAPLVRRLDEIVARLDQLDHAVGRLTDETIGLPDLRKDLVALREDVWHAKAVNLGDRLLVGCRHLGLVFIVDPDDRLIGPRFIVDGEYEPETTAFVRRTVTETSVCIDVGANFGYYTCLFGHLAWRGHTLSYEADPQVHTLLRDNVNINWCERTTEPINAAVSDTEGKLTLYRRLSRSGNTSIIQSTSEELEAWAEADSEEFVVDCIALDSLTDRLPQVDLVKIDVEGAETLVVRGMGELVRRHRPTVLMEWSPWQTERAGFSVPELVRSLAKLDLTPHVLRADGELDRITHEDLVELSYQNVVLVPTERAG